MAFLLPALIATLAAASPMGELITKQSLNGIPDGWQQQAAAPADHKIDLFIRVKPENQAQLEQRVIAISTPGNPDYGKHLSRDEVDAFVAPTKANIDAVTKWLSDSGINSGVAQNGYVPITVTVSKAKELLDADYAVYKNDKDGRTTIRTTGYSLPQSVHDAIDMVQPTTMFSDLGMSKSLEAQLVPFENAESVSARAGSVCATEGFDAACLKENYNIKGYTPANNKTTFGITGFLGEVYSAPDLKLNLEKYAKNVPADTTLPIISINNGTTVAGGEGEANLDTQITIPLTWPVNNIFWSTGGEPPFQPAGSSVNNTNEPYLEWLQYIAKERNLPTTITSSYGDDERTVPEDYARAVCFEYLKLGARGVSFFTSAGDAGAGNGDSCATENGKQVVKEYLPDFPASCPWVTTVGGTSGFGADEAGEHDGGSGFSNYFSRPFYQWADVERYLHGLNKTVAAPKFNRNGRAYPDLAAAYSNYPIYFHGKLYKFGGTSASCPTTASIFALINDYRVTHGKAPLGFLNPWLYLFARNGVRDIAKGNTNVCKSIAAFPAAKGWDSSTGLGAPDFEKLLHYAKII